MIKPEYYIFTIFIFILLCALLYIYRRFILQAKGRKPAAAEELAGEKEKEERLFRLYQNMEEMMDNFEAYIEDTRGQMEASKAELTQQVEKNNDLLRRVEATEAKALAAVAALRPQEKHAHSREASSSDDNGRPAEGSKKSRQDAIRELLSKGMTVEQIAQNLELSINEVKLVVYGLMKKKE